MWNKQLDIQSVKSYDSVSFEKRAKLRQTDCIEKCGRLAPLLLIICQEGIFLTNL